MIANETPINKLTVVSRLLAYQKQQDVNDEVALDNIRSSLPAEYHAAIDALSQMLKGDREVVLAGYGAGPYQVLSRLIEIINEKGASVSRLFAASQPAIRDAVLQAREYWSGFSALIIYIGLVLLVTVVCIGVYTIFVFPQFQELFENSYAKLPVFTQYVMSGRDYYGAVIVVMVVLILASIALSQHIRRRVAQFLPLSRFTLYLPGVSRLSAVYTYYLFIQYADILSKAGVSGEEAIAVASDISRVSPRQRNRYRYLYDAIQSASSMGSLESEIEYQAGQVNGFFNRQMIYVRERMALILHVSIGLIVGSLLLAMYLPIFKMGSVI